MLSLEDIISDYHQDPRSIQRAVVVKMIEQGIDRDTIRAIYQVSYPYMSKWWRKYQDSNRDAQVLLVSYKGSCSYLSEEDKQEVLHYIQGLKSCRLEELKAYLQSRYQVSYRSDQSYYDLLKEAGYSWKKTQKKTWSLAGRPPSAGSPT